MFPPLSQRCFPSFPRLIAFPFECVLSRFPAIHRLACNLLPDFPLPAANFSRLPSPTASNCLFPSTGGSVFMFSFFCHTSHYCESHYNQILMMMFLSPLMCYDAGHGFFEVFFADSRTNGFKWNLFFYLRAWRPGLLLLWNLPWFNCYLLFAQPGPFSVIVPPQPSGGSDTLVFQQIAFALLPFALFPLFLNPPSLFQPLDESSSSFSALSYFPLVDLRNTICRLKGFPIGFAHFFFSFDPVDPP